MSGSYLIKTSIGILDIFSVSLLEIFPDRVRIHIAGVPDAYHLFGAEAKAFADGFEFRVSTDISHLNQQNEHQKILPNT